MVSRRHTADKRPLQGDDHDVQRYRRLMDKLNLNIIKELLTDPDISSTQIASKFGAPLSTIQRRRTRLERSILLKEYNINTRKLGWRTAELLIAVEKGESEDTAKLLLEDKDCNVISTSLRIGHPQVDVMASIFYKDTQQLHRITETVKAMPYVTFVEWAEVIKVIGKKTERMFEALASGSLDDNLGDTT